MAGGPGEPQVAARDRRRPPAGAMGDVTRARLSGRPPQSSPRPLRKDEDMMDLTPLRDAYGALLDAAATVAGSGDTSPVPPPGEWNADQILAHVTLVNAATI